jgi:hypothetical protein
MVQFRALSAAFILSLLSFTTLITLSNSSSMEVGAVPAGNHDKELQGTWQRKLWMNHGSFRGPRKHLLNPTVQHPFQAREFPV